MPCLCPPCPLPASAESSLPRRLSAPQRTHKPRAGRRVTAWRPPSSTKTGGPCASARPSELRDDAACAPLEGAGMRGGAHPLLRGALGAAAANAADTGGSPDLGTGYLSCSQPPGPISRLIPLSPYRCLRAPWHPQPLRPGTQDPQVLPIPRAGWKREVSLFVRAMRVLGLGPGQGAGHTQYSLIYGVT